MVSAKKAFSTVVVWWINYRWTHKHWTFIAENSSAEHSRKCILFFAASNDCWDVSLFLQHEVQSMPSSFVVMATYSLQFIMKDLWKIQWARHDFNWLKHDYLNKEPVFESLYWDSCKDDWEYRKLNEDLSSLYFMEGKWRKILEWRKTLFISYAILLELFSHN